MKVTPRYMHYAISAGVRARGDVPEIPTNWFFATKTNGERPIGAPPS